MAYGGLCTQMEVPPELQDLATSLAIQENPSNMEGHFQISMGLPKNRLWSPGRTLRVKITNGSEKIQEKIRKYANVWTKYANIKLDFVEWGEAEIRVNVDLSRQSWSFIGSHNLAIAPDKPTMNFGWFQDNTPEEEFRKVILHEFGHAMGCIHEHQSPANGIPWNRTAVYKYFANAGMDEEAVDKNVLKMYDRNMTQYTKFDENSIMLYAIPSSLTLNGFSTKANSWLSDGDRSFISYMYPTQQVNIPFPDDEQDEDEDR